MKYLKWKWATDAGYFEFYDKEAGENKKWTWNTINLEYPIQYKVEWFVSDTNEQIFSNIITRFDEPITVRTKNNKLFEGKYSKADVEAVGGRLHIILRGKDSNWDDVQISLKGTNYFNMSTLLKEKPEAIKITWVEDGKKGAVKFKSPKFEATKKMELLQTEDIPF